MAYHQVFLLLDAEMLDANEQQWEGGEDGGGWGGWA